MITRARDFIDTERTLLNQCSHTYMMCLCEGKVLHVMVVVDISSRDMLCCCILNPKSLLRVNQIHTCGVNWTHHSVTNVSNVVLLSITKIFW